MSESGRPRWRRWMLVVIGLSVGFAPTFASSHPLTIDDVLATEHLDRATLSPDGAWVAAVVQRAAAVGEVYGRAAYETDPSRDDVWLVSPRTGERRLITHGATRAAGYWCATWSPDGQRLAMLSTAPEKREPRGGDNVRLYVWDRATGRLSRMSDDAVMTQGRYGSGVDQLDLRGGGDRGTTTHACTDGNENAPFLWLDKNRLLAVMLPQGGVSGLIDQYGRPFRIAARDAARLRDGRETTASAVGSGDAAASYEVTAESAFLRVIDARTRALATVAKVPTYPFRSRLTVTVSPDGQRLAVLATLGAIPPQLNRKFLTDWNEDWTVKRRLGLVDLTAQTGLHWVATTSGAAFPLELYGWSPDSRTVAFRARSDGFATASTLFAADSQTGGMRGFGTHSVGGERNAADDGGGPAVLWVDTRRLVARETPIDPKAPPAWTLIDTVTNATTVLKSEGLAPARLMRASDGTLFGLVGAQMVRVNAERATLTLVATLSGTVGPLLLEDSGRPASALLVSLTATDGGTKLTTLDTVTGRTGPTTPLGEAYNLIDFDAEHGLVIRSHADFHGLTLSSVTLSDGHSRDLIELDTFMRAVDWGKLRLIDYTGAGKAPLEALAILPPDYHPGRRYPTLVWVYEGTHITALDDYWADPFAPGIYNLQLYAARGYVVLIPSMPLPARSERRDVYTPLSSGVMPAIDRLIALGIADPDRLGVFGQSFGGYSTYGLVTQTDRFKAAVAMAGITDIASYFSSFDPGAKGYPGIEHQKSDNWAEVDLFGQTALPWENSASYARNSPLSFVEHVHTPLLMIHGGLDMRGSPNQAEQFFYALYMQGKTAKLLRYGGESHSLAQSPANVRDIFAQTVAWFDRYVKAER